MIFVVFMCICNKKTILYSNTNDISTPCILSMIHLAFNDLVNANRTGLEGKNLTVHTASQDFLSFLRVYYDPEDDRVFPFLTAIVDVDKGRVKGIAWDNSCVFCSPDRCLENTYDFDGNLRLDLGSQSKGCYVGKRECDVLHQNKSDSCNEFGQCFEEGCNCDSECDIRVFVVWTGTDIDNNVFQSSASRFSAFPAQNIQDRIKQNLPDLPDLSDINPFDRREKE